MSTVSPEALLPAKNRDNIRLTRLGLAAGIAAFSLSEFFIGPKMMWRGEHPETTILENPAAPNNLVLNFSGFHVPNTEKRFGELNRMTLGRSHARHIVNYHYPNAGFNIADVQEDALGLVKLLEPDKVVLNGHSMGGMVALDTAAYLHEHGADVTGVIRYSSPTCYDNVRPDQRRTAEAITKAVDQWHLRGGPVTRLALELWHGERSPSRLIGQLGNTACSPELLASEAKYIRAFDAAATCSQLDNDMLVYHLSPEDYTADRTVDNQASVADLRGYLSNVHEITVPGAAHANIDSPRVPYARAVDEILEMCFADAAAYEAVA